MVQTVQMINLAKFSKQVMIVNNDANAHHNNFGNCLAACVTIFDR